jgi:RNA polymerase sigma-70 factor (ECF subfamily)
MPDSLTSDFVDAIRNSDKDAFRNLYREYYEPLYRFAWRYVRDNELALDLVQETFTRLWIKRQTLDSGKPIKPFLYKIIHNLVIDHVRKQSVREDAMKSIAFDDRHEDDHESNETVQTIQNVIHSLPDGQQEVFRMNRYEGLKYNEIAEILGLSVKAVEKRMSKALQTLRAELKHLLFLFILLGFFW